MRSRHRCTLALLLRRLDLVLAGTGLLLLAGKLQQITPFHDFEPSWCAAMAFRQSGSVTDVCLGMRLTTASKATKYPLSVRLSYVTFQSPFYEASKHSYKDNARLLAVLSPYFMAESWSRAPTLRVQLPNMQSIHPNPELWFPLQNCLASHICDPVRCQEFLIQTL